MDGDDRWTEQHEVSSWSAEVDDTERVRFETEIEQPRELHMAHRRGLEHAIKSPSSMTPEPDNSGNDDSQQWHPSDNASSDLQRYEMHPNILDHIGSHVGSYLLTQSYPPLSSVSSDVNQMVSQQSQSPQSDFLDEAQDVRIREHKPRTDILALIERSNSIQKQLRELSGQKNSEITLYEIVNKLEDLLLDYERSISRQCTPGTFSSASGRGNTTTLSSNRLSGEDTPSRLQYNQYGYQSVWDDPTKLLVEDRTQPRKLPSKRLRCFYYFDEDPAGQPCETTWKYIRDLM